MASLMLWVEALQDGHETAALIRAVVLSVGRLPLLAGFLRVPPDVYRLGWDQEQQQRQGRFSPVAVHHLQEADVLKQYILRVNTLGWTGRREFEETWMTYLSVLNAATEDDTSNREELAVLLQTNCLAVRGITSLLLQTLTAMVPGHPGVSATLHHPRHQPIVLVPGSSILHLHHTLQQLEVAVDESPLLPSMSFARQLNLERRHDAGLYGHGQLSLRYLQGVISGNDGAHSGRDAALAAAGLDINSCLVFLLQLYAQWMAPEMGVPLPLLTETVRSAVLLSDLLTERSQFEWLLAGCVALYQVHPIDDEVMLQYLVLGLCKAAAVLDSREATVVETVRRAFIQLGLQQIATVPGYNDDYDLAVWAAAVYVMQHYDDGPADSEFSPAVLQLAISLAGATRSAALYEAIMKGIERLVVCGVVSGSTGPLELAVEQLRQRRGPQQLHALSLLTACLFSVPTRQLSPEMFVHVLEKYSVVFTKMKSSPAFLSTVLCGTTTSGLLRLCPPSELMNRVIGEFISPHQSHAPALADTVFQVFEACVSQSQEALLRDWVLFSLPNFATVRPAARATWRLACFLAGASRRPWLRAAFPLLQRCGDEVDLPGSECPHLAAVFLVAARDFYSQLSEPQRRQFLAAIEAPASGGDPTYKRLLLSLTDGSTDEASG
ncbi:huntingtin-like [Pollicipes pollicipes]|uniref:huntingtin-like n=1 Tax=Pollicipes pollicipes TaxID=41117 RepID=UPI0018856C6D|nr:huntingtin-like [Pollicipes pollicipes]